jgi:hypothetical protein
MGISETHTKTDGKAMNIRLQAYAKHYGFVYGGPILEPAPDKIHAKNYGKLYIQATDSLNKAFSIPIPAKQYSGADLIFGDSNAHGMRTLKGLSGGTKIGNGPKSILDSLQAWPREDLKNKIIFLTTGASNNVAQIDEYVPQQLKYLKEAGVAGVVVMGMSEKQENADGAAANVKIPGRSSRNTDLLTAARSRILHLIMFMQKTTINCTGRRLMP